MDHLKENFKNLYGDKQTKMVKSPLRICPLGARVDHQDGVVTGMALDSSVEMVFAPSKDGYIRVRSMDFPDEEYFHLDSVPRSEEHTSELQSRGHLVCRLLLEKKKE